MINIQDDINSDNFALATTMLGYEGAVKGTKKDGAQKQVLLPLLLHSKDCVILSMVELNSNLHVCRLVFFITKLEF